MSVSVLYEIHSSPDSRKVGKGVPVLAMQLLENLDELRVGLYVKLDCSWWSHPFASGRFKIGSDQEIETIRNIRQLKLYYDPTLSDFPISDSPDDNASPDSGPDIQPDPVQILEDLDQSKEPPGELENEFRIPSQTPDPEELKRNRRHLYFERRAYLKKVEDAYWKVLAQNKDIFKRISSGHAEGLKGASTLVSNIADVLNHKHATMTLMDVVSSTGMTEGLSSHALNVCIFSTIIGRELGLPPEELNPLGMGALFHDMGKRLVPMKVNFRAGGITMQADQESMKQHPVKGKELMETHKAFSHESLEIIHQHHERLDGSGYPQGLKKNDISYLSQIVLVADEYDELCNASDIHKCLTPHEALSQLYKHTKHQTGKYPEDIILALIRAMSVFPPGTLVELTDGSIGIVTSINLKAPTKPLILIPHLEGTRQEALAIDLEVETSLTIRKSLRPKDIPPKVLEFLSPRRTGIFLHAPHEQASSKIR